MKLRHKSARPMIALALVAVVVFGFGFKLYDIQIRDHDYYMTQNSASRTYKVTIPAARGDIVDRNGNPIVTSRQGNSIILDATVFPSSQNNDERNTIILNLISLFEKNGEEYVQNLPLQVNANGQASFKLNDDLDEDDVATMKSEDMLNLQPYATAQNCYDAVVEKYGLESYDPQTAIKIANIRYELTKMLFAYDNPVTIAEDVSAETVAAIKDNTDAYRGADVMTVAYREYTDTTLAPHLIGTVRKINAEEYKELKDQGYDIDGSVIKVARRNAREAGVDHLIHFQERDVRDLSHPKKYGFIITNPPYGERLEDKRDLPDLYRAFGESFRRLDSWSAYMITSYEDAERYFGRKAQKNRKIYNGMLKTYFYQFPGPKPPRKNL